MIETTNPRDTLTTTIGVLTALYSVSFFIGSLLHLSIRIPLGFAVLAEPRIIPATIVEGFCGIFLAVGAYAMLARRTWAWQTVTVAHVFALGGVLLGMAALAVGAGPSTELNTIYHRVMLVALAAGLVLLLTPVGRVALGRSAFQAPKGGNR